MEDIPGSVKELLTMVSVLGVQAASGQEHDDPCPPLLDCELPQLIRY
jgi:hypothetical protein